MDGVSNNTRTYTQKVRGYVDVDADAKKKEFRGFRIVVSCFGIVVNNVVCVCVCVCVCVGG